MVIGMITRSASPSQTMFPRTPNRANSIYPMSASTMLNLYWRRNAKQICCTSWQFPPKQTIHSLRGLATFCSLRLIQRYSSPVHFHRKSNWLISLTLHRSMTICIPLQMDPICPYPSLRSNSLYAKCPFQRHYPIRLFMAESVFIFNIS